MKIAAAAGRTKAAGRKHPDGNSTTGPDFAHSGTNRLYNSGALVTQHRRQKCDVGSATYYSNIGPAYAGGLHAHQRLSGLGSVVIDCLDSGTGGDVAQHKGVHLAHSLVPPPGRSLPESAHPGVPTYGEEYLSGIDSLRQESIQLLV